MRYSQTYPLETFADVAAAYEKIKPMRGKYGGKDVRPIENRRRPWHRVVKMDDNTYLLSTWTFADPVFASFYLSNVADRIITREEQIDLAPIVWRRHEDGTETVTVRNSWDTQATGHYSFLHSFLPLGLTFAMTQQGKHYVTTGKPPRLYYGMYRPDRFPAENVHFLGRTRTAPGYVMREVEMRKQTTNYKPQWMYNLTAEQDGAALTFKRTGDQQFAYVSGGVVETVKRHRVSVDAKKPYADQIKSMFEFIMTMRPLLPINDYEYVHRMADELMMHEDCKHIGSRWNISHALKNGKHGDAMRKLLSREHPAHLNLCVWFMASYMWTSGMPQTKEELSQLRAEFNGWINRACGFAYTIDEPK